MNKVNVNNVNVCQSHSSIGKGTERKAKREDDEEEEEPQQRNAALLRCSASSQPGAGKELRYDTIPYTLILDKTNPI